jgi:molecular chaperone DnaK (HSP70)
MAIAELKVHDVWLRTGEQHRDIEQYELKRIIPACAEKEALLLVQWRCAEAPYLALNIKGLTPFEPLSGSGELDDLLAEFGKDRGGLPQEALDEEPPVRLFYGKVEAGPKVDLEFEIDTNSAALLEAVRQEMARSKQQNRDYRGLVVAIKFEAHFQHDPHARAVETLPVRLDPADALKEFDGYVGIDLGNTNSTIVLMPSGRQKVGDIRVVNVNHNPLLRQAGPVPSALRIEGVSDEARRAPSLASESPASSFQFKIGHDALGAAPDQWLVLGVKRLLANTDATDQYSMEIDSQELSVDRNVPAELFLCGLIQGFFRTQYARVGRGIVAVTCPSTFSSKEIERLHVAVMHAIFQAGAMNYNREKVDKEKVPDMKRRPMIIDEASAAAFYFIYNDFIKGPGGQAGFNWLYPDGLNILVFDCGGGTTDVALVRAATDPTINSNPMSIRVLGRSGHRSFGGDNITLAAVRILKMRLAESHGVEKWNPATTDLATHLQTHDAAIERAVPTRFDPNRPSQRLASERRRAVEKLWALAEALKESFSKEPDNPVKATGGSTEVTALEDALKKMQLQISRDTVEKLSITRAEIDSLITADLDLCIGYANNLIREKLKDGEEVHRIYVVGSASLYPTVGDHIKQKLAVRFVEDRLSEIKSEDIKGSVAKGAVVARRYRDEGEGVDVQFDMDVIERLPFDVVYRNDKLGRDEVLFSEDTTYEAMREQTCEIMTGRQDGSSEAALTSQRRKFILRKWPGDQQPSPFLRFDFIDPIIGPLTFRYGRPDNLNDRNYYMTDAGRSGATPVVGKNDFEAEYMALMQCGKV